MFSPAHPVLSFWPPVPDAVRDDYTLAQYAQLSRQVPLLYCALILIVFAAMASCDPAMHPAIRLGLPMAVELLFCARLAVWLRRPHDESCPERARRIIARTKLISISVAGACAAWSIHSWSTAPADRAMYFPLYMAMGSFATISTLSVSRSAGFGHILAGLGPLTLALLASGNAMATAAGATIATTCLFLMALLRRQHERTVELMLLQHRMQRLAETDPLTGLMNRRAMQDRLAEELAAAEGTSGPAVMLIDLDGFKPVNDRHGHAAGDAVLCEVAARLTEAARGEAHVCRLGGDEFAVLVPATTRRSADTIGSAMLAALARPFTYEGVTLAVGASLGMAAWPGEPTSAKTLFRAADDALYAAKQYRDQPPVARLRPSGTRG